MGILSGNPQDEPMHYGEVFGLWSYVMAGNKMVGNYQMLLNHVGDDDLKKLLRESIEKCQDEIKQVSTILKENGVALPPASPEPPTADLNDIPCQRTVSRSGCGGLRGSTKCCRSCDMQQNDGAIDS